MKIKEKILVIDTSALLSGRPLIFNDARVITASSISEEIKPGGRDHRNLEFLIDKGLSVESPSTSSINIIKKTAEKTGDLDRLSRMDIEILALALDYYKREDDVTILTDDYSIQNIAETLNIRYQGLNQSSITKKVKWIRQCPGCKKKYNKNIKICYICGTETKQVPLKKKNIR